MKIIDQCVAQGVPFAREYGGLLANRSFGGAQVSRTFYARGQTGQQLLLGAYQALEKEVARGGVTMYPRTEMLDLVVVDGHARGIVVRDMVTGKIESHAGDAVVLGTGGYGNVFYLSTNAKGCNVTAIWRAHKRGAAFANPCYTQIHPTCIPVSGEYQSKLTLMSESLRNDGRVWVPKRAGDNRPPGQIPENERDYYLERKYPSFGNLAPRDIASRAAKEVCDEGRGVGPGGLGVYLDFADAIKRLGDDHDPGALRQSVRDVPADHRRESVQGADADLPGGALHDGRALGRLQPDEHHPGAARDRRGQLLRSRRQPPRRERAHAGAGRRLLHPAVHDRRLPGRCPARRRWTRRTPSSGGSKPRSPTGCARFLAIKGKRTVDSFHRELGRLLWDECGMARNAAGLQEALARIPELREEFWRNVNVPGSDEELNQALEKAGRVADFLEFGELMCRDALHREESCGGHFREEHQTDDGEARRDDEQFAYVAAWEYTGDRQSPRLHKEPLEFEYVHLAQRSYK